MNQTLGQILQEKRLSMGFSIEQVSSETKISSKILRALEADDYKDLPAKAFMRGFILSYAKLLELDGSSLFKEHQAFFDEKMKAREDKSGGHSGYTFEEKELEQNRRWIGILATAGILFVAGALFILKPKLKKRSQKPSEISADASPSASSSPGANGAETNAVPDIEQPEIKNISTETVLSKAAPVAPSATVAPTPTPVTEKPAEKQTEKPKPSPTPTTSPTTAPSVAPSASPVESMTDKDPLQKGDDIAVNEVGVRVSFKSLGDQYVVYRSDQKKPAQIILREGKFLVIKGRESIAFKTQDASKLTVRLSVGGAYKPLTNRAFVLQKGKAMTSSDSADSLPNLPEAPPPPH